MEEVQKGKDSKFKFDNSNVLWYQDCLCVPNVEELWKLVLEEAHHSPYTIHPGLTKMYQDLKQLYSWDGIRKDVEDFVAKCLVCKQMKA